MKLWVAREPSGLLILSEFRPIWCADYWYTPADSILDLCDKNLFPEVTFENSPQQVELKLIKE